MIELGFGKVALPVLEKCELHGAGTEEDAADDADDDPAAGAVHATGHGAEDHPIEAGDTAQSADQNGAAIHAVADHTVSDNDHGEQNGASCDEAEDAAFGHDG